MKNRIFAFLYHLGISALVVGVVLSIILLVWYPAPFFYTQGLSGIIILLVSVDLVLGPTLTFLVFKKGKSSLRFDLSVIALIQFTALFYGVYQTFTSRPVYVVYANDKFDVVSANEFLETYLKPVPSNSPYLQFSLTGPRWVGAILPQNTDKWLKEEIDFTDTFGAGLRIRPQYYVPFDAIKTTAINSGKPASQLKLDELNAQSIATINSSLKKNQALVTLDNIQKLQVWLNGFKLPLNKIILTPMKGFKNYAIVAMDKDSKEILGTISIDPWWH